MKIDYKKLIVEIARLLLAALAGAAAGCAFVPVL